MDRLHIEGGHGFVLSWVRLALLVAVAAAVSAIFTTLLLNHLVSDKVSLREQTKSFRAGCDRNVGQVRDVAQVLRAERDYKRAVLAASSVKGDVKEAVTTALETYDAVLPKMQKRVIACDLAFPSKGKPKIVRLK